MRSSTRVDIGSLHFVVPEVISMNQKTAFRARLTDILALASSNELDHGHGKVSNMGIES